MGESTSTLSAGRGPPVAVLRSLPLSSSHDGKRDKEDNDADDTDDVRHDGNRTSHVARVGPDQTDDRSDDEHRDQRG